MKIYMIGIAKEYGCHIIEQTYRTLDDATYSFEKYKDFYFRALTEIDYSRKKPVHRLLKKIIDGKVIN